MDAKSKKFVAVLFGLTWIGVLGLCVAVASTNARLEVTARSAKEAQAPRPCTTEDKVYVAKRQIISENSDNVRELRVEIIARSNVLTKEIDKLDTKVEEALQGVYYMQGQMKALINEMMSRNRSEPKTGRRRIPTRMVTGKERAFYEDLFNDIKEVEKDNK